MKLPDCLMEWDGTKAERVEIIEETLDAIHCDHFSKLSRRNFNRLFLDAFVRNSIQAELVRMMQDILEE